MPQIYYKQNRRSFLKSSAQAAGLLTAYGLGVTSVPGASAADETHLALLSDTHIAEDAQNVYRGFYPYKNLQGVVPQVLASKPDAVLINGDVARLTGEKGDYAQVKGLLAPLAEQKPIYMTLGNHDDRDNIQAAFPAPKGMQEVKNKHVMVVEQPTTRFILLDSLMYVNKTPGLLGQTQRGWLEEYLQTSDAKATVLFVHHTLSDQDSSLLDVERLFQIIRPHQKVKAIFYGHSHEYKYDKMEGIHLVNQPAVGYNFADSEPVGWLTGKFGKKGVDLTLHAFAGNLTENNKSRSLEWR
ncbi:metallophosphoesterase family protein [Telluribacter sp.]|jgi:3',5'-cyclic AMP phosphodiesterase CpdA|uniref:metallophosphoesterase family protein n=1 Tax=Telluribacter sp. TaxID=1978767 RepID=UPI002E111EF2|nr:metallophosphoesterase [Telluribacter sp.]